MKIWFKY